MSAPVSRGALVWALLKKEFLAYRRDTLYLFLTVLSLVFVIVVFFVTPDEVDESITLAVSPPIATILDEGRDALRELGATDEQLAELDDADLTEQQEGLVLVEFDTEADLTAAIEGDLEVWRTEAGDIVLRDTEAGDEKPADAERVSVDIGIAFPRTLVADVSLGDEPVDVTVYSDAGVPDEIRGAMKSFVREVGFQLSGTQLPVTMPDEDSIVLGSDRAGDQVSLRDKLVPMLAFMILLMEAFSLSSLISVEVLQRTVTALLVTPVRVADLLVAKSVFGTGLALVQGLFVLGVVGAFTPENWLVLVVTMLIGSMMFTGIAMIVGSAGKDFIGTLFYSMMFVVPLIIPAFSVLFPGSAAPWVRLMPTFPVIDSLVGATVYGETFADLGASLAYAAAWLVVLFGAGLLTLKRKVESL